MSEPKSLLSPAVLAAKAKKKRKLKAKRGASKPNFSLAKYDLDTRAQAADVWKSTFEAHITGRALSRFQPTNESLTDDSAMVADEAVNAFLLRFGHVKRKSKLPAKPKPVKKPKSKDKEQSQVLPGAPK